MVRVVLEFYIEFRLSMRLGYRFSESLLRAMDDYRYKRSEERLF